MTRFLDQAKIHIRSGSGGDGCVSFRREKFVEFGGTDGGDGGRGGSIVVVCADTGNTLIDYRYRQHFRAPRGGNGMGKDRTGASAPDLELRVPAGTEIQTDDGIPLLDVVRPGERHVLLPGGHGGRGNARFATSTNRAPRTATRGREGREMWIRLRLKLIADAGLVGLPNAGKSTFLATVTQARPKIAPYPFTTLMPGLGVVLLDDHVSFVLADLPGLIRGAHEGTGLGDRFLGHVERCSVLLHLVDATQEDVADAYRTVRHELRSYGADLAGKPEILALSKVDAVPEEEVKARERILREVAGKQVLSVSSAAGSGIRSALFSLAARIQDERKSCGNSIDKTAA